MRAQPSPGGAATPRLHCGILLEESKKHGRGLILQPEAFAAGRGPPRPLHTPGSGLLQAWRTRTQPVSQPTGKTRVCDERAGWLGERKAADRGGDADQTDGREQSQEGGRAGTEGAGREGRHRPDPGLAVGPIRPSGCYYDFTASWFSNCVLHFQTRSGGGGSGLVFRSTGTMPRIQERMNK